MQNIEIEVAKILLEIKAVHLSVDKPFTWTSGIISPIYCDNRQIMGYPKFRKTIAQFFADMILKNYPDTQVIAGTATAGIAHAAWIADIMNLPMVYVRSESKGHGLKNLIEGKLEAGQKVVLIEDLISTGKSSVAAALALKDAAANVLSTLSIFNYGLKKAQKQFSEQKIAVQSLSNVETLIAVAQKQNLISNSDADKIKLFMSELDQK